MHNIIFIKMQSLFKVYKNWTIYLKFVNHFLQKSSNVEDFWLGSKCGPWQYYQGSRHLKGISKVKNFLCLYSYHVHFIFSYKSEKRIAERNKRLNLWSLYINWGTQWLILADWITENGLCQIPCAVLELHINYFSRPNTLPKVSEITDLPKVSKNEQVGYTATCLKSAKLLSILNCSKLAKWPDWKLVYFQSWRS